MAGIRTLGLKKKVISSKYSPLVPLKIGAPPSSFLAPLKLFFLSQTSEIHEIDGGTLLFLYVGRIWSSTHQPAVTPATPSYRRKPPSWVLSESPQQLSYSSLPLAPGGHHTSLNNQSDEGMFRTKQLLPQQEVSIVNNTST